MDLACAKLETGKIMEKRTEEKKQVSQATETAHEFPPKIISILVVY